MNAKQEKAAAEKAAAEKAAVTPISLCIQIDDNLHKTSALVSSLVVLMGSDSKAKSAFLSYLKTLVIDGDPAFSPNTKEVTKRPANYDKLMKKYNRFNGFFRDENKRNGATPRGTERTIDAIVSTFVSTLTNKGYSKSQIALLVTEACK